MSLNVAQSVQYKYLFLGVLGQKKTSYAWILSYNNSSYPTKSQLLELLKKYSNDVKLIEKKHKYQITGKYKKNKNKEFLFIIKNKRRFN